MSHTGMRKTAVRIEKLRLKNFKVFKDARMNNIPPFCAIVGANGSGKSILFDAFSFLQDCVTFDVTHALRRRGGFREVVSRGHEQETIELEIKCRIPLANRERLVTYLVEIGERHGKPCVVCEEIKYKPRAHGQPVQFLKFSLGRGEAVVNEADLAGADRAPKRTEETLAAENIPALKAYGEFSQFMAAHALRRTIERWHFSDFSLDAMRNIHERTMDDDHLSASGDNLQRAAHSLFEKYPHVHKSFEASLHAHVPCLDKVLTQRTLDGRVQLQFAGGTFGEPSTLLFDEPFVSDGTLLWLAFLVLLHDPRPHPLLCAEEPENHLCPFILEELAGHFRTYARRGGQVMVSTHSQDLLNAAGVDEVYWLEKGPDGFSRICKADEDEQIVACMDAGDKMGRLWRSGMFGSADPV